MPPPQAWVGTGMPTGVVLRPNPAAANLVDDAIATARLMHAAGVNQIWLGQRVDFDAIGLAGLIGAAVPGLGVGTSVVPVNPRHPLLVASQAQTAQAASHGNFSLGLGLGSHDPERKAFGTSWPDPLGRLREHLTVLRSIFDTGSVDFHGDHFSTGSGLAGRRWREAPRFPCTWRRWDQRRCASAVNLPTAPCRSLPGHGPSQSSSSLPLQAPRQTRDDRGRASSRPSPCSSRPTSMRVAPSQPNSCGFYGAIPSYQRVIAREGLDHVADLAAIGSADAVRRHLKRYLDAGATDVVLNHIETESVDAEQLWEVAASI